MRTDKKGTEKLVYTFWFFVIVIVTIVIVSMVNFFYSSEYDVQDLEVKILADKVADCLITGGNLTRDIFSQEFNNKFLEKCNINFKDYENSYYTEVEFYEFNSCDLNSGICNKNLENSIKIETDNKHLKTLCVDRNKEKKSKLPVCLTREIYSIADYYPEPQKNVLVKITAIVNKGGENE